MWQSQVHTPLATSASVQQGDQHHQRDDDRNGEPRAGKYRASGGGRIRQPVLRRTEGTQTAEGEEVLADVHDRHEERNESPPAEQQQLLLHIAEPTDTAVSAVPPAVGQESLQNN